MAQLDKIVAAYRVATQYPALISARILDCSKASVNVHSVWVQRVLERQAKTRFRQTVFSDYKTYNLTSPPTDITNELISAHSKSTKYFCVVREIESGKEIKQYLEVWADFSLVKNYDLSALDVHGKIYADGEFGTLEWSPDETKIVYIAEKKVPKSEPFYKQKPKATADKDVVDNSETVPGKEYDWSQDWGEQLVGKITPVLVVCDIKTDTIDVLSNIPNDVNPATAVWTPDGKGVVAVGYTITPRKLGLIYCTNRPSHVFSLTLDGQYTVLSSNSEQLSVKTPKFNLNGTKLVWLERLAGGPHHSCFKLMACNWFGNIGDADVKDVYNAVQSNPLWSNRKLVLFGGSHGGFLVTQLSGQYPSEFKAVCALNPVTDLITMFGTTDIPEWDITEGGYNYSEVDSLANSKDVLMKLADCSPCKNVHKVQAPTLLLLGKNDLRVPPSQGLSYYHLLKKHGITARLLMYDDCHPLSTVAADMDSSINTALWFKKYTSDDSE